MSVIVLPCEDTCFNKDTVPPDCIRSLYVTWRIISDHVEVGDFLVVFQEQFGVILRVLEGEDRRFAIIIDFHFFFVEKLMCDLQGRDEWFV